MKKAEQRLPRDQRPARHAAKLLEAHYSPALLNSAEARVAWVPPDRLPLPGRAAQTVSGAAEVAW